MTLRAKLLASTALLGIAGLLPVQARAGLLGAGATVQAAFYNGQFAGPSGLIPDGGSTSNPTSLAAAVNFTNNVSQVDIHVGDTQITLTNTASGAFCVLATPGTACVDEIDGFDFKFTGENILGVLVDPASASAFLPVSGSFQGNTHLGAHLLSDNEIQVDLTGDSPSVNDHLILDLQFTEQPPPPPPPPTSAPEPATMAVIGSAVAGLFAARRRRKR